MKKRTMRSLSVILGLMVGLMVAGCDNGSTGGGGSFPSPKGKITVNGLSNFEGKYIMGTGSAKDNTILLIGYTVSNNTTYNLTKITNGKAEIPVYSIEVSGLTSSYKAYAGSDSVYEFGLTIFDSAKMSPMELVNASALGQMDIPKGTRFSNGNMTITWDSEGGGDNPGGNTPTEKPFEYPASSINSAEIERISTYLAGQSGGTSASNLVNLAVNLQLIEANTWALLDAIGKAGKYVSLDLSACTQSSANTGGGLRSDGKFSFSTEFDTGSGMGKIVSLTLPNAAVSCDLTYVSLSQLASISGASITSILAQSFYGYTSLTSVSFPKATSIGDIAFKHCTSLTSVSFPNVTSIGNGAFGYCDSLTSVDIPANTPYGSGAFDGCPWQPTW